MKKHSEKSEGKSQPATKPEKPGFNAPHFRSDRDAIAAKRQARKVDNHELGGRRASLVNALIMLVQDITYEIPDIFSEDAKQERLAVLMGMEQGVASHVLQNPTMASRWLELREEIASAMYVLQASSGEELKVRFAHQCGAALWRQVERLCRYVPPMRVSLTILFEYAGREMPKAETKQDRPNSPVDPEEEAGMHGDGAVDADSPEAGE